MGTLAEYKMNTTIGELTSGGAKGDLARKRLRQIMDKESEAQLLGHETDIILEHDQYQCDYCGLYGLFKEENVEDYGKIFCSTDCMRLYNLSLAEDTNNNSVVDSLRGN